MRDQIMAGLSAIWGALTRGKTTILISAVPEGCVPPLGTYKVSYFDANHRWTSKVVQARSADQAASELGLVAGRNCFVSRQLGR